VIVSDWGGVRGNKPETLSSYIKVAESSDPSTPLKGIASYSKILSIVAIDKYAIYDARVAACLNAVQFNYGIKKGMAFNYVDGRNNIIGHVGKKIGFVYQNQFTIKELVTKGWEAVKPDFTYSKYLTTIKTCLSDFPNYNLFDLEMALFAKAEQECSAALNSISN